MKSPQVLTLLNGNAIKILISGEDTDKQLTVIDYMDFTQSNPPPFTRHGFIEVFTMLEGTLSPRSLD